MDSLSRKGGFEPGYSTLEDWILAQAIPFSLDSTELNDAIDRAMARIGDTVRLLGFGEALHGKSDILLLRNRLFIRLVENHGFVAMAIESSFPRGRLVDQYIAGQGPDSFDDILELGFSHGFGRLDANRELVEWMREYNSDPSHVHKLHFYGFDSPTEMLASDSPKQLIYFVLDFLGTIDPVQGEEHRQRIEPFLGQESDWDNPDSLIDPAKSIGRSPNAIALRAEVEDLYEELLVRRPELVAGSDPARYQEAVHYAALARQQLSYHAELAGNSLDRTSRLLGIRDAMMAENLAYITSREGSQRGRVMAFAHNRHLQRGRAEWQYTDDLYSWWPAGSHLDQIMGSGYAVIGTAVGVSSSNGIGKPEESTLEARLTAAPGPARLIPTCKGQGLPADEIASLPRRSGSAKNPTYFPLGPESLTDFDWLAVFDSTA